MRLTVGLVGLGLMTTLFMSGVTPPGVAGEVIRHNRAQAIDASPLFYSDVENMQELETAARALWRRGWHRSDTVHAPQRQSTGSVPR